VSTVARGRSGLLSLSSGHVRPDACDDEIGGLVQAAEEMRDSVVGQLAVMRYDERPNEKDDS